LRISKKHKFVYLAPARSGSTSIRAALEVYSDVLSTHITDGDLYHHINYQMLKKLAPEIIDYRKFTVIRDPFQRSQSLFNHHLRETNGAIKYLNSFSPLFAKLIYWSYRCISRGPLCATVTSQTDKGFTYFLLEDQELTKKISDYLNVDIKTLSHLNMINRKNDGTDYLTYFFTYVLFYDDIKIYKNLKKHQ
jgi:hypothetical protein